MKTSIKTIFAIAAGTLLLSTSAFANDPEKDSKSNESKEVTLSDEEISEVIISLDMDEPNWLNEKVTYNIYNQQDELVYSKEIQRDAPINDAELVKLLGQSDLLMTLDNSSYYRLSK